jgi:hypothetical protein
MGGTSGMAKESTIDSTVVAMVGPGGRWRLYDGTGVAS